MPLGSAGIFHRNHMPGNQYLSSKGYKQNKIMVNIIETRDHELLAVLNEEMQTWHHLNYPAIFRPYDREAMARTFQSFFNRPQSHAYLAVEDGKCLGYLFLFVHLMPETAFMYAYQAMHIDQVLVLEHARSRGIGKLLLDEAELMARNLGINRIDMNHWAQNELAHSFFSRNGFISYNERMYKML